MGPSRECDGDGINSSAVRQAITALQWGRRVNATETTPHHASRARAPDPLQWGRRVNATETPMSSQRSSCRGLRFNGAVA